jgi:glycosyltransferase involved in cell wall biosynthesis
MMTIVDVIKIIQGEFVRILFVNPYYKPYLGGIERIIEQVSQRLLDYADVEAIGLLTTRAHFPDRIMQELPAHEFIDGIDVYRCTFKPLGIPRVFHPAMAGYFSLQIPYVLRQFRPDIIHFMYSEWWSANLAIYLATRRMPHVLYAAFHDWPVTKRTLPLYLANRWLGRRLDAVQVQTEMEQRQVHHSYYVPDDRIVITPPGVDVPQHVPDHPRGEPVTILAVGRISDHKGQLVLIKLVHRLIQERPDSALRIIVVGGDGGGKTALVEYVTTHGLEAIVQLVGYCSDAELQTLYQEADLFALPTRYESFGIVFVEALAYGVPVITYAVGPVPDVLQAGALLVPPGDEQAFSMSLIRLIDDPELRLQLGRAGRAMVQDKYSWRATTTNFHDLYSRLLVAHRSTEPKGQGQ